MVGLSFSDSRFRRVLGLSLCALSAVIAVTFAALPHSERIRTVEESEFDVWSSSVLGTQEAPGQTVAALPRLTVVLGKSTNAERRLSVDPAHGPTEQQKVSRLLALMREAHLFSLPSAGDTSDDAVSIIVEGSDKNFARNLSVDQIRKNTPAALFLKLFEVYSSEESQAAVAQSSVQPESSIPAGS